MALCTRNRGVHACQRIVCIRRVIKRCVEPVGCRVACGAVLRQAKLNVRRIIRPGEVRAVAPIAACRCSFVDIVDMTCDAGESRVRSGQRVSGVLEVVELRAEPTVHGVAAFATGGKSEALVVDNRRR